MVTENIEVFTQSSIRLKGREGIVYADPFRMREEPKDADYILITHDHYDHFSPEDIGKAAKAETILVVPEKMEGRAQEAAKFVGRIVTVKPGTHHNTIKPSVAIPIHYGSIVGKKEDADKFAANVKPPVRVETKMLD